MNKYFLSIWIFVIYGVTILYPYFATTIQHSMDSKNSMLILHGGIIHYPSIIFIVLSAFILHYSVKSKADEVEHTHKQARKNLKEAIAILDLSSVDNEKFKGSDNIFCKDIKFVLLNGGIEEDIELVINKHISSITSSYEKLISEYSYIATVLPMLGMIGTITGLLQMFAVGDGVDNFSEKLASLSVALATTLYATLWVVFLTKPKSREIENWLIDIDNDEYKLIVNSKLYMHNVDISVLNDDIQQSESESISEKS